MCTADIFLALIAILFPPLPVWVKRGLCSPDSLINIALCCLGFLPGMIHAWYIIYNTPDFYEYERVIDVEGRPTGSGNVQYYYISDPRPRQNYGTVTNSQPQQQPQQPQPQPQPQSQPQQAEEGTSNGEVPPPYNEAIKGDHKIQKP